MLRARSCRCAAPGGRPPGCPSLFARAALACAPCAAWSLAVPDGCSRLLWDVDPDGGRGRSPRSACSRTPTPPSCWCWWRWCRFLVQVYSLGYLADEPPASLGRYYTYQSLFAFSMMGLVLAPNFVQLFICWELVGLCSYLLIGYWYHRPEAARAAVKAFWITKAGDVGLPDRHRAALEPHRHLRLLSSSSSWSGGGDCRWPGSALVTFCIYLGAVGKSAQFPLHVWLPDAMEGPTPVSALIHAATMVTAGVYLLCPHRVALRSRRPTCSRSVGWIGAFTALLAAMLACVQTDIKRVLAYSTVSQLGYMMAAIGAGFAARRLPAPAHPRRLQGAALPGRGRGDPRGRQQRHLRDGRPRPAHAADLHRVPGGHALARGHSRSSGASSRRRRSWARSGRAASRCPSGCWCSPPSSPPSTCSGWCSSPSSARPRPRGAGHDGHGEAHAHDAPLIDDAAALDPRRCWRWPSASASRSGTSKPEFAAPGWLTPLAVAIAVGGIVLAWLTYGRARDQRGPALRALRADPRRRGGRGSGSTTSSR